MEMPAGTVRCPKCDDLLAQQSTGEIVTRDIAHQRETVAQALAKFKQLLVEADTRRAAGLRLVVGSGLIRDAVMAELATLQYRGEICEFDQEGANRGAIRVILRPGW